MTSILPPVTRPYILQCRESQFEAAWRGRWLILFDNLLYGRTIFISCVSEQALIVTNFSDHAPILNDLLDRTPIFVFRIAKQALVVANFSDHVPVLDDLLNRAPVFVGFVAQDTFLVLDFRIVRHC